MYLCKVLLTSNLENKNIISAFNDKIIQQYIPKIVDNLTDEMIKIVNINHVDVVYKLNEVFFEGFCKTSPYNILFSDKKFIKLYENMLIENSIKFACVYESNGSMILINKNKDVFLFNIYSQNEINNLLFESIEFESNISEYNKNLCKKFELIVDYKEYMKNNNFSTISSYKLTDEFDSVSVGEETYYCVLQKLVIN